MENNLTDKVYNELNKHIGEKKAISAQELANIFNISPRSLRIIISEIRNSTAYEKVIGSNEKGYFVCTTDDVKRANNRLFRSAYSLLKTAQANSRKAILNGQGRILSDEFLSEFCETLGITDSADTPEKGEL